MKVVADKLETNEHR